MNIDIKDVITLDGKEKYVVCSKIEQENNSYLYLMNAIDTQDIKFAQENHRDGKIFVSELEDEMLIRQLLPLFYEKSKDIISEIEG